MAVPGMRAARIDNEVRIVGIDDRTHGRDARVTGKTGKMMKRVALITGGTRGIGLGIARALAQSGVDLAIIGRRDLSDVIDAISEPEKRGASVMY
jgi:hypothetical protein